MSASSANGNGQLGWPWTVSWPLENGGMPSLNFAPERLWQPINPGWTFGNVIVNANNSKDPALEQTIVSQHSYGRQIGRLVEAVEALAKRVPGASDDAHVKPLLDLAKEIKAIRVEAGKQQLDRLLDQLEALKKEGGAGWKRVQGVLGR